MLQIKLLIETCFTKWVRLARPFLFTAQGVGGFGSLTPLSFRVSRSSLCGLFRRIMLLFTVVPYLLSAICQSGELHGVFSLVS